MSPLFRRDRSAARDATSGSAGGPEPLPGPGGEGRARSAAPGGANHTGDGRPTPATTGTGPYDADDPAAPASGLVDLGGLRVPAVRGLQLRLDVDKGTSKVVAATLVSGASAVQLTAFAAPRSRGLWDEIRTEITETATTSGGSADEREGEYGTELLLRRPTTLKDGRQALQIQRYCGIEGPRWLLRAVFTGPDVLASAGVTVPDEVAAKAGGDVLRRVVEGTVVVRGPKPMAPRDPLPLVLPEAARRAAEQQAAARQSQAGGAGAGAGAGAGEDGGAGQGTAQGRGSPEPGSA